MPRVKSATNSLPKTPKKSKRVTDKMRLDWIQRNAWEFFHDGEQKLWKIYLNMGGKIAQSGTIRKAIDFAISRSL